MLKAVEQGNKLDKTTVIEKINLVIKPIPNSSVSCKIGLNLCFEDRPMYCSGVLRPLMMVM